MKYSVIPEPCRFEIKSSDVAFDIYDEAAFEAGPSAEKSLRSLISFLEEFFVVYPSGVAKGKIRLEISGQGESEGYSLKVERGRVLLRGNDEKGLFYAVQTLKQLFFCGDGKLVEIEIEDKPRFRVRGFMLDCARHFFSVEAVKQFIDMMAFHKLNEFHWHLSDDQGFRCQLEDKLLLTEIGSYRPETEFNGVPHKGYYTKNDIREIIDYAHDRYIKVIPEINSPGHVRAMLAAYPGLACFKRDFDVSTTWGTKNDVLCIGKESTFDFMKELYDEVTEIFTDGILHIGGDATPTVRWQACPDCLRRMQEEGLGSIRELHSYYLDRIASYLTDKGVEVRIRDTALKERESCGKFCCQLSSTAEEIKHNGNLGDKCDYIVSCSDYYNLDNPYIMTGLERCYSFEPDFGKINRNIIGVECCLWTEYVPDMLTADRLTYPRLAAVCEGAWSAEGRKSLDAFKEKLQSYYSFMEKLGIAAAPIKKTEPSGLNKLKEKMLLKKRKIYSGRYNDFMSDLRINAKGCKE